MLIAHIDVVAAKRSDWERDPFQLIEEDGYFYGRGTSDTKGLAAVWTDILMVAKYFPGVPLVPQMANGYTDATFLGAVGIPTYGVPGMWRDPDGNGAHGLNERLEVAALYTGRDFLSELVALYASK